MGQIKNIKLHIVTDIKNIVSTHIHHNHVCPEKSFTDNVASPHPVCRPRPRATASARNNNEKWNLASGEVCWQSERRNSGGCWGRGTQQGRSRGSHEFRSWR